MKLVDVDELLIAFGFDWSDIMPTREELIEWIRNRKEASANREQDNKGNTWCGHCGYGFGDDTWIRYCPSCGYKVIVDGV